MADEEVDPQQLVESIKQLKVADVLLSAFSTVAQLGYAKLDRSTRDLDEARLAIDSLRALVPVLEETAPPETLRDLRQLITNLQLAYASAAAERTREEPPREEGAKEAAAEEEEEEEEEGASAEEEEQPGDG